MRELSIGAPRISCATGIIFLFLIAHFTAALSAIITYRSFNPDSSKLDNRNRLDDYIPGKWRDVPSEPRPPQIDIHLLKGHVLPENENWAISVEYKYSPNKFKTGNMEAIDRELNYGKEMDKDMEANVGANEVVIKNSQDNEMPIVPQFGSRRIVDAPSYCPEGQRKDQNGKCRPIMRG